MLYQHFTSRRAEKRIKKFRIRIYYFCYNYFSHIYLLPYLNFKLLAFLGVYAAQMYLL